ncbi:MAG: efflux RND transporter periplasmic adaptor subunit [Planctomycetota bacterium]
MPVRESRTEGAALINAAYREEDFPALRLARSARFVRRLGKAMLAVLVLLFFAMLLAPWQQSIRGEGEVIAFEPYERPQMVYSQIKGLIGERGEGVDENAFVKQGALLFRVVDLDPNYLGVLTATVENAKAEKRAAEQRLERAKETLAISKQIVTIVKEQLSAEELVLEQTMRSYEREVDQSRDKLEAEKGKLLEAQAEEYRARFDFERKKELYEEGIESEVKYQEVEQKYKAAQAKVEIAKRDIAIAQNGILVKERQRDAKRQEIGAKIKKVASELQKTEADVAKADGEIEKIKAEIQEKDTKKRKAENDLARQQTQEVKSPCDGYVMNLTVFDGMPIKPGDPLCRIVPIPEHPAVQIWVSGRDAPLIHEGDPVRLQFEGWPAVQFAGWPSVAVGTFGGTVSLVDATDDGMGKFRILVVPDESDHPWPGQEYLRQGVRSNGWVLLDQVALGYEVWRRMNGFPPALQSKGKEEKLPKPPKV